MANREPSRMERTRYRGIYKRGDRYVVRYRAGGKNRAVSARTLTAARRIKRRHESDRDRGEWHEQSHKTFREYGSEWVERYQGKGSRGFREATRDDYRRDLRRYAFPFFGDRTVSQIAPRDVAEWIGWLCDEHEQGRGLADATVRRIVSPVRACLGSAVREGLIRHNPTAGAALPHRPRVDTEHPDEPETRALSREQLAAFLDVVHPRHRLLFRLLASTGLRVSEAFALSWRDLHLEGSAPRVKVRRALAKPTRRDREEASRDGGALRPQFVPPKSRHGTRSVPLDHELVAELRQRRRETEWPGDDDLVFTATNGAPLRPENVFRRVLKPAAEEAGAPWAGFHTFRHTCASLLFERGANAVQVQRWLGHHSPAFTLSTYVHLLDDGAGEGLDLTAELAPAREAESVPDPETVQ
jgi:integrase